ncbi:MAG TPA: GNAT family N-acetyltransferase [Acidimicrobiales bacterium]|nr:GNAT family N-acetyltransferase [Acidimicrobiales bacterium]
MTSPKEVVLAFMAAFIAAWPEQDAGFLAGFLAADAVYHNMLLEPVRGLKAIEATVAGFMAMGGRVEVDIRQLVAEGAIVAVERVDHFESVDRTISLPMVGVFEVANGKITAWRDYFDAASWASVGSPQERSVGWYPPESRLEAGGVALRTFEERDAPDVAEACRDRDILRFTFMPDGLTDQGALEWIRRGMEWWPRGNLRFAIVKADSDRVVGQVGLGVDERHRSAEGYYWVAAPERGRGVASTALGLVVDWAFTLGLERIFLLIHPQNEASNRLAARMGFTREGVLRSYEPVKDDRPDLVSWSLLPGDPRPWRSEVPRG